MVLDSVLSDLQCDGTDLLAVVIAMTYWHPLLSLRIHNVRATST